MTPYLITGHTSSVGVVEFAPFDPSLLATGTEDGHVKVWKINGSLTKHLTADDALFDTGAHNRSVRSLSWHPFTNILASSSVDNLVFVWDVEAKSEVCKITLDDSAQHIFFNQIGNKLAILSKDKKLRIVDPRTGKVLNTLDTHQALKAQKGCWISDTMILTAGFSRESDREIKLWDLISGQCLKTVVIDQSSGVMTPWFDEDTNLLYLAGKGDGNIRMYEVIKEAPYINYCNQFSSTEPQVVRIKRHSTVTTGICHAT